MVQEIEVAVPAETTQSVFAMVTDNKSASNTGRSVPVIVTSRPEINMDVAVAVGSV
jgi:hypothetical protein